MNLLDIKFLRGNLCFMYRIMQASEGMLDLAARLSDGALQEYYLRHLEEETGHDRMVAEDLQGLGVDIIPDYFAAAELAGSQYYLIAHRHPAALLGYMNVLESNSLSLKTVDELEAHHNSPLTAFRHHAIHDPTHSSEINKMIGILHHDLQRLIHWNAACVQYKLKELLTNLRNEHGNA